MRLVISDGTSVGLNAMWLPTWIGSNAKLLKELETELSPLIVGQELTEKALDEINQLVLKYLTDKFKLPGLFRYLDALKFLEM